MARCATSASSSLVRLPKSVVRCKAAIRFISTEPPTMVKPYDLSHSTLF